MEEKDKKVNIFKNKYFILTLKILLTALVLFGCYYGGLILLILLAFSGIWVPLIIISVLILPMIIPFIWLRRKALKKYLLSFVSLILLDGILIGTQLGIRAYNDAITIDVTPAIIVYEYYPFDEESKIVQIRSKTLNFLESDALPRIDGAAAAFPVYSAFVNATYPESTKLYEGPFVYNNTVSGYELLAERQTDIFIGAAPNKEQKAYAEKCGTTFKYTQIGSEAFVFFVHKDNPIESLTTEQIRKIYSGEITNWSEVGGDDKKIVAYQRNEGSGSQSMLVRFMGDTPIMEPDMKDVVGGMGDIIEEVADYKSNPSSIGFSFRFYVEGIIKNPDIKLIAIDGVAPTVENIKNGSYPIVASLYAVTYEENTNENVDKLVEWMLSDEGQYIITETGYVGVK